MTKTINLFGIRKKVLLYRSNNKLDKYEVYMESITKEKEDEIDNSIDDNDNLSFYKNDELIAFGKDIILYGVVDFSNNSDIAVLNKYKLINEEHAIVHSGLDYDTGIVELTEGRFRKHQTFNPVKWFKYNHILLGKPKRIICYKVRNKQKYGKYNRFYDNEI